MDHRWGIVLNEDQIDQSTAGHIPIPFWQNEIGMPSLLDQSGCTYSMLEPSQFNVPGSLDMVHSSSGFPQQRHIGWSEILSRSVVESAGHGRPHIHAGFNKLGSSSAFQDVQACANLRPCSNSHVAAALNSSVPQWQQPHHSHVAAALNSSVPQWQQPHHQQKKVMGCTRKAPYRNPAQREVHILSERQRREEMNEKLCMLRSILPTVTKKDKASTITHAIKHLTELEEKVKSLRSCKAIQRKQCQTENADSHSAEQLTETQADNSRSSVTFSKQFGGDSEDDQPCKIEIQNFGTHATLQIICPWSPRLLLRTHKALEECRVDVVQCIMTKHGGNAVYYSTVEFTSATPCIDKLISTLEEASSI